MNRRSPAWIWLAPLVLVVHAAAPGCLRVDHGIVVELRVGAGRGGPLSDVTSPDGTSFRIDSGEITIEDAILLPCPRTATQARLDALGHALLGPAVARAHDHGGDTEATTISGPFRISLVDPAATIGAFAPPPGSYCALHLDLGPAGDASEAPWSARASAHTRDGIELVAWTDLTTTAHVVPSEPFDLTSSGARVLDVSLYDEASFTGATFVLDDPRAFGDALLHGITAQAEATLSLDDD